MHQAVPFIPYIDSHSIPPTAWILGNHSLRQKVAEVKINPAPRARTLGRCTHNRSKAGSSVDAPNPGAEPAGARRAGRLVRYRDAGGRRQPRRSRNRRSTGM